MKNQKLSRKINSLKLKAKANQPQIMVYGGVGMMAAGTGAAIVATTKLPAILDKMDESKDAIHNGLLTGEDQKKALLIATAKGYGNIALNYAPSAALTIAGAASVLGGFGILKKHHAGVVAALATTTEAFAKYRSNVVEEFGEETDYRMKHSIKTKDVTVTNPDGTTVEAKEITCDTSQYAVVFSKGTSTEWKEDPSYNYSYIKGVENYVNTILAARNHVFLNEVYDQLGMERTEAGAVTGWIYKDGGDGYIDFGLEAFKKNTGFMDGQSPNVILDFNVDGVIFDIFNK